MNLTVTDMIRAGDFTAAVAEMQYLTRLADPTEPVDVATIRAAYEERRAHLRSVTPTPPFRVVVELVSR